MIHYSKSKDGTHFFKREDGKSKILHVLAYTDNDKEVVSDLPNGIRTSCTMHKDTFLINNIPESAWSSYDKIPSDQLDFEFALNQAIFGLGIYERTK